jgi:hypothetical protein
MVIISIVSYPTDQVKEVAKRLRELPPLPSYMTMKGPYLIGEVGAGIKAIIIYEYDQPKTKEAMEYVGSRIAKYFGVPGFTYSVNIWFEVNEALKMTGLG